MRGGIPVLVGAPTGILPYNTRCEEKLLARSRRGFGAQAAVHCNKARWFCSGPKRRVPPMRWVFRNTSQRRASSSNLTKLATANSADLARGTQAAPQHRLHRRAATSRGFQRHQWM